MTQSQVFLTKIPLTQNGKKSPKRVCINNIYIYIYYICDGFSRRNDKRAGWACRLVTGMGPHVGMKTNAGGTHSSTRCRGLSPARLVLASVSPFCLGLQLSCSLLQVFIPLSRASPSLLSLYIYIHWCPGQINVEPTPCARLQHQHVKA